MATASTKPSIGNGYPTSDGKPMAETDLHRDLMLDLIKTLQGFFGGSSNTYVSGNLLIFYEPGNKRKHVSPDVFVVRGVPNHQRINYLTWEEGKNPEFVIEVTSSSTHTVDMRRKFALYQDTLRVSEYFLFDPLGDYLDPPMRGYRLVDDSYAPIELVDGRLPSEVTGLHLERRGSALRLFDPMNGKLLPTPGEMVGLAEARAARAEAENERLRLELENMRRELNGEN